jgi:hypothetical protein
MKGMILMTKTERYMWLANDLLLTAGAWVIGACRWAL